MAIKTGNFFIILMFFFNLKSVQDTRLEFFTLDNYKIKDIALYVPFIIQFSIRTDSPINVQIDPYFNNLKGINLLAAPTVSTYTSYENGKNSFIYKYNQIVSAELPEKNEIDNHYFIANPNIKNHEIYKLGNGIQNKLEIKISKNILYVGEPGELEIIFVYDIKQNLDKITINPAILSNANFDFIENGDFKTEETGNRVAVSGKLKFYPKQLGNIILGPITLVYTELQQNGFSILSFTNSVEKFAYSNYERIEIKDLPKSGINYDPNSLVGVAENLKIYDAEFEVKDLQVGEVYNYSIFLEADSDLNKLDFPNLIVPGFRVYKSKSDNYIRDDSGTSIKGKKIQYGLQPLEPGSFIISVPKISYFDFKKEQYEIVNFDKNFSVEVFGSKIIETQEFENINTNNFVESSYISVYFGIFNYLLIIFLPIFLSMICLIYKFYRNKNKKLEDIKMFFYLGLKSNNYGQMSLGLLKILDLKFNLNCGSLEDDRILLLLKQSKDKEMWIRFVKNFNETYSGSQEEKNSISELANYFFKLFSRL